MSIQTADVVTVHLRGKCSRESVRAALRRTVEITVRGREDLARLAAAVERRGDPDLAARIRASREFSATVTPDQWAVLQEDIR